MNQDASIGSGTEIFAGMVALAFLLGLVLLVVILVWMDRQLPGHHRLYYYLQGFSQHQSRARRWRELCSIAFLLLFLAAISLNRILAR